MMLAHQRAWSIHDPRIAEVQRQLASLLPGWHVFARSRGSSTRWVATLRVLYVGSEVDLAHEDPNALVTACRDFEGRCL